MLLSTKCRIGAPRWRRRAVRICGFFDGSWIFYLGSQVRVHPGTRRIGLCRAKICRVLGGDDWDLTLLGGCVGAPASFFFFFFFASNPWVALLRRVTRPRRGTMEVCEGVFGFYGQKLSLRCAATERRKGNPRKKKKKKKTRSGCNTCVSHHHAPNRPCRFLLFWSLGLQSTT